MSIRDDIFEMNRRLTYDLWHLRNFNQDPHQLAPRLITPKTRSGKPRISEQEAKALYVGVLNNLNYFFSLETPTKELYVQRGKRNIGKSANHDLSLFWFDPNSNQFEQKANYEFKSKQPGVWDIQKDLEKLIRERETGVWIHILESCGKNSFEVLFDKIIKAFKQLVSVNILMNYGSFPNSQDRDDTKRVEEIKIIFYFYSVKHNWACMKELFFTNFKYDNVEKDFLSYLQKFFQIKYQIRKSGKYDYIEAVKEKNGWIVLSQHNSFNVCL